MPMREHLNPLFARARLQAAESAPLGPDGQIFNRMLGGFSQVSTGRLRTADC